MILLSWSALWFLALVFITEGSPNELDLFFTCDESGLNIKMTFEQPFKGLVYVKGYSDDPNCRLSMPVSTLEASFNIPLMACDTLVRILPDSNPWMKGFLVFQQHPLVPTVDDFSEPFMCIAQKTTQTPWPEVLRKASYALYDTPKVHSWLDFGLLSGVLSVEQESLIKPTSSYVYLYVHGAVQFSDAIVTDCVAHMEPFLLRNSSINQLTNPNLCSSSFTHTLSPFTVMKNGRGFIVGAYSEISPTQVPEMKGYLSCSAVLCQYECDCTSSAPIGYEVRVTRKLPNSRSKRSIEEQPLNTNNVTRNSLMRSTVKVLSERIMKYRKQSALLKSKKDLVKRSSISETETMDTEYTIIDSSPSDQPSSTELTTEAASVFDAHTLHSNSFFNLSTTIIPEEEVKRLLTNLVEATTETFSVPETTSRYPFSGNPSVTLVPDFDLENTSHSYNHSNTETISYFTTVKETSELDKHGDINFPVNSTVVIGEKNGNETILAASGKPRPDVSYCVAKFTFVAVTSVLSFIIICLIFISCGLGLYLKKEKRNHVIDSYLLYNYY